MSQFEFRGFIYRGNVIKILGKSNRKELIINKSLPCFLLNFSERCKFAPMNFSERCKYKYLNFSDKCKNEQLNFSERYKYYGNEKKDLSATP